MVISAWELVEWLCRAIFQGPLYVPLSVLMVLACYYKGMLENGNDAKNPVILGFFFLIESRI